jgi:hypothetical protein
MFYSAKRLILSDDFARTTGAWYRQTPAKPRPARLSSTTADPGSTSSTVPSSPCHRWELSTIPPRPIIYSNQVGLEPEQRLPVHNSQTVYILFLIFTQRL